MSNPMITLVGEELNAICYKWSTCLAAPNASIYGIPYNAGRAVKFNPVDKSMTEIGPNFGDGQAKWEGGAITDNGVIYCPPSDGGCGVLKIDTNTDDVTELDLDRLPEQGRGTKWKSCALHPDGCIYFIPHGARRIMKLDLNNYEAFSSVGNDLGGTSSLCVDKYHGAVVGMDGLVYGFSSYHNTIVRYDPINNITVYFKEAGDSLYSYVGNAVVGRDGCIYILTSICSVLKFNTTTGSCYRREIDRVNPAHFLNSISNFHGYLQFHGFGNGSLGIDGCIYWPPCNSHKILKFDPHSNLACLVGRKFGSRRDYKWNGGCMASDGIIYCLPLLTNRILAIDPWEEYARSLKENVAEHPKEFGRIFQPSVDIPDDTHFDRAVTKFGQMKVLELLDESMPPVHELCIVSNLYPFMIAASCKGSHVSVIYHLMCKSPSYLRPIVDSSAINSLEGQPVKIKKRKYN